MKKKKKTLIVIGLLIIFGIILGYQFVPSIKAALYLHSFEKIFPQCTYEISYAIEGEEIGNQPVLLKMLQFLCGDIHHGKIKGEKQDETLQFSYHTEDDIPVVSGYTDKDDIVVDFFSIYQYIRDNLRLGSLNLDFLPEKIGESYISYNDLAEKKVGVDVNKISEIVENGWKLVFTMKKSEIPESQSFSQEIESMYFLKRDFDSVSYTLGIPKKVTKDIFFCYLKMEKGNRNTEILVECQKNGEIQLEMPKSSLSEQQMNILKSIWQYFNEEDETSGQA